MVILFGEQQHIPTQLVNLAVSNPILKLVKNTIDYDPSKRPDISQVQTELAIILLTPPPIITSRISIASLNVTLPNSVLPSLQSRNLSLQMETLSIIQKSIQLSNQIHPSIISGFVHDQRDSHLCWAFSTSTVIRAELKRVIILLHQNGIITAQERDQAFAQADQMNKENRLLFELVCLVNPRSPKLADFLPGRAGFQTSKLSTVMGRICFDGLLRPAGWTRLPSVRRVTDVFTKWNYTINSFYFKPIYFGHPLSGLAAHLPDISYGLNDIVSGEGKPAVGIVNGGHAVVLVKEENNEFVFKNSYGPNNPNHPELIRIPTNIPPGQRTDFKII